MKEKLTPQEKKRLSYKKDHRTHTGESDRGMRRTWAKRKARVNRKYRRKTGVVLRRAITPDRIDTVLAGDDGTTHELIRKGLTREDNHMKWGVRKLREVVEEKLKSRAMPRETERERNARLARVYMDQIIAFEKDPYRKPLSQVGAFVRGLGCEVGLWDFLTSHSEWKDRLNLKVCKLQKEEWRLAEKAKVKSEEKRKWKHTAPRQGRS
ncbi:MAG TPA: hypothetical protein VJN89_04130 [Candidatus Acidoferrum sp.]|nr:hypothetical protein [Candidatus Acidoferrum sp.]